MPARQWILAAALLVAPWTALATARAESPAPTPAARDVLRKTMEPLIDLLSREPHGPNRALLLRATVTEASTQPPALVGSHLTLCLQPPDKALFQFLALESVVTVCRQGQTIWVAPADKLAPLLAQVEAKTPTSADKEPIAPVRLKVPPTLFWLLFRLVPVKDAGERSLDGVACRRVDLKPPDADDKNGFLRLWMREDSSAPARLDWHGSESHSTLLIDEAKFLPALPPDAFDPAEVPPVMRLAVPAERFRPLMTLLNKLEDERRKKLLDAEKPKPG